MEPSIQNLPSSDWELAQPVAEGLLKMSADGKVAVLQWLAARINEHDPELELIDVASPYFVTQIPD